MKRGQADPVLLRELMGPLMILACPKSFYLLVGANPFFTYFWNRSISE